MTNYERPNERKSFIIRTAIILTLLIGNVVGIYLYYYVLVFNAIGPGKVYGESIFKSGQYKVNTVKYYYQHKGISYFDKIDYVVVQDLQLGDSLAVRVFRPYPTKHMVDQVFRDESKNLTYNCEDGFIIQYNEEINDIPDYEAKSFSIIQSEHDNCIHVDDMLTEDEKNKIIKVIDNIRFNHGSLIEYFILKKENKTIYLHLVNYYLNDFSTDAMPSKVMYNELTRLFPNKTFHISVLDKDQAKKERILNTKW